MNAEIQELSVLKPVDVSAETQELPVSKPADLSADTPEPSVLKPTDLNAHTPELSALKPADPSAKTQEPPALKPADANAGSQELYIIPAKFRNLENLHILFWLVKDICWCTGFKPLGVAMIFPTLSVAIYIAWKNRQHISELAHNTAITLWITANSMWMAFEFTNTDAFLKNYCLIPFGSGLFILLYYYLVYVPLNKKKRRRAMLLG